MLNFLEVQSSSREALQKFKGTLLKKESITSEDEGNMKKNFFTVSWRDEKIHVSNSQILDFFVNKTNKEIISFHNKLVNEKRLKMELLSDESD